MKFLIPTLFAVLLLGALPSKADLSQAGEYFNYNNVEVFIQEVLSKSTGKKTYLGLLLIDQKQGDNFTGSLFKIEQRGEEQLWIPLMIKNDITESGKVLSSILAMPQSYNVAFSGKIDAKGNLSLTPTPMGQKMGCMEAYNLEPSKKGEWLSLDKMSNEYYFSDSQKIIIRQQEEFTQLTVTARNENQSGVQKVSGTSYGVEVGIGNIGTLKPLLYMNNDSVDRLVLSPRLSSLVVVVNSAKEEAVVLLNDPGGYACYWPTSTLSKSKYRKFNNSPSNNSF